VLGSPAGCIVAWKSLRNDPVNAVGPTAIMLNDFVSYMGHLQSPRLRVLSIASIIAWNWTELRRCAIRQIQKNFVDIAPPPSFWRIVSFDDWVFGRMEMFRSMAIRRVITTADMAARAA
jgi:hypothetical protein